MSCPLEQVTDVRSNPKDQIHFAAEVIRRSDQCKKVFQAIYRGKKKIKSVGEISVITGLKPIQVLKAGGKLHGNEIVQKLTKSYQKDKFIAQHYRKIMLLASNSNKFKKYPTKVQPKIDSNTKIIRISFPKSAIRARNITIDDIDSFQLARNRRRNNFRPKIDLVNYPEENIKDGIKKIISEGGTFKDWGGEKNDLYTTKIRINGKRKVSVFAFKGKGTKGALTLDKMGKRADQIHRLFDSNAAEAFLVVYKGQVHQIVLEQMHAYAIAKTLSDSKETYYGIIDGDDLKRLIEAYIKYFKN